MRGERFIVVRYRNITRWIAVSSSYVVWSVVRRSLRRARAEGPRGACVIQVIRSAVYLLLKFCGFKEIEGRE